MIILLLVWIHLVTKDRRQYTLVKNKGDIFDLWNLFGTRHSVSVISQHYFFLWVGFILSRVNRWCLWQL